MSDQYDCPAEGCGFVGSSDESLRGHWGGKTDDEAHSGSLQARLNDRSSGSSGSENSDSDGGGGGRPTMPEADDAGGGEGDALPWEAPCGCGMLDLSGLEPPTAIRCPECERQYEIQSL